MEHLLFSLNATVPVFLIMVLGYLLRQCKLVDASFVQTLNSLNYKFTLPVLLFRDISTSGFTEVWDTKYVTFCFAVTLSSIMILWVIVSLFYKDKDSRGEFIQGAYRSSAAVLGIAFIQNIYGDSGMAPLMIIATVPLYNIAAVLVLSFTGPNKGPLNKERFLKSCLDILRNPIIWGILLGMIASCFHITFPVIVDKSVSQIAALATPLALIGLGAGFEGAKALGKLTPTLVCSSIKLVILPALFLPLAMHLGFTGQKLVAILIMLGSPTTVSCYIMAKHMGHEGTLTGSTVVATTFLSSVTLTIWLYICKSMGYL